MRAAERTARSKIRRRGRRSAGLTLEEHAALELADHRPDHRSYQEHAQIVERVFGVQLLRHSPNFQERA